MPRCGRYILHLYTHPRVESNLRFFWILWNILIGILIGWPCLPCCVSAAWAIWHGEVPLLQNSTCNLNTFSYNARSVHAVHAGLGVDPKFSDFLARVHFCGQNLPIENIANGLSKLGEVFTIISKSFVDVLQLHLCYPPIIYGSAL